MSITYKKLKIQNGATFEPELTLKTINSESILGDGNINTKYIAGPGIQINEQNNAISVDDNTVAWKSELAEKQDKLTADEGIFISDTNIIGIDYSTVATLSAVEDLGSNLQTRINNLDNSKQNNLTAGDGIKIIDDTVMVDSDIIPYRDDVNSLAENIQDLYTNKQDKLTAGTGISISSDNEISANPQSFNVDICYPNGSIYFSTKRDETTVNTDGKYGCIIANSGGYWVVYNTDVAPYAWERIGTAGYSYSTTKSITTSNAPSKPSFMAGMATIAGVAEGYDKFILDSFTCSKDNYNIICNILSNNLILSASSTTAYPAGSTEIITVSISGRFIRE